MLSELRKGRILMFSLLNSCRGNGKIFIEVSGAENKRDLHVRSFVNGKPYPSFIAEGKADSSVVVLPDLCAFQKVCLYSGDKVIARCTAVPFLNSLISKFNGLIRKDRCANIRNADRRSGQSDAHIIIKRIVPAKEGFFVEGEICDLLSDDTVSVHSFDLAGNYLASASAYYSSVDHRWFFSLKIGSWVPGVCFVLTDSKDNCLHAIEVIRKNELNDLIDHYYDAFCDAAVDWRYRDWFPRHCLSKTQESFQRSCDVDGSPVFSIIVPLYKTPLGFFKDMANSVLAQTYSGWELILVNSTPEEAELRELVLSYAKADERIRVIEIEKNLGITKNTEVGINAATGDFLCFFDHDDVLEPDLLFEYASAVRRDGAIDLLYCDEDKLLPDGSFSMPTFKPDFSIDMIRDNNYICHLLAVRRAAYDRITPSGAELDGAQDHAMVLKVAELGGHIHHVPKVLYHWRISETSTAGNADSKPYCTTAGILAVQQHLDRLGINASVSNAHGRAFRYRVDYHVNESTMVDIIVILHDDDNAFPVDAVRQNAEKFSVNVTFVCHASSYEKYWALLSDTLGNRFSLLEVPDSFNAPSAMNYAASQVKGDCFIFVDGSVLPKTQDWVAVLAGFAMRSDVGIVGTMCCDQSGIILQAGYTHVSGQMVALSRGVDRDLTGYLFFPHTVRNVSAIDYRLFALSRHSYDSIGAFDENLSCEYAIYDYSFRSSSNDKLVVYTPEAWTVIPNRLLDTRDTDKSGINSLGIFSSRWCDILANPDPFFSCNFSDRPKEASLYKLKI